MYHDQGLPVLKYATFGHGVNITLGLPLIRTSVDHGTALDLAAQGLGLADCGSMEQAIDTALAMAPACRMVNSRRPCKLTLEKRTHHETRSPQTLRPELPARQIRPASITEAIAPAPDDAMVEIGPGLGAMTEQLLRTSS